MDKTTTKTSKVAAWILWIVNFNVMMVCLLTVAFGLWIISSPTTISAVIDASGSSTMKALLHDTLTLQVGIALTAIAVFLFFVSFMGFYGAITRSPFLLFMYSALVLLLLLLECALLYYFSSNLVEKGLQDDGQWTHAMRLAFQCCEHNTSIPETKKPPWSCCGADAYPDNCTSSQVFKKVKSLVPVSLSNKPVDGLPWVYSKLVGSLPVANIHIISSVARCIVVLLFRTTIVSCISLLQLAFAEARERNTTPSTSSCTRAARGTRASKSATWLEQPRHADSGAI